MLPLEKPGTPTELAHHGVKGMHWGVRKQDTRSDVQRSADRKAMAKKVAIGTGVLVAAAGATYIGVKLHQNGNTSVSSIKTTASAVKSVQKTMEHTDVIHFARGKNRGLRFQKKGGASDPFVVWEKYLGKYANAYDRNIFDRASDGTIGARFADPLNRFDKSGRGIDHEVIIPKAMAAGIHNHADVVKKVWPLIKDTYDPE